MTRKNLDISAQQSVLRRLIIRGDELLCAEGKGGLGYWGDIRGSSTSLWSISECGLDKRHPQFIRYCLDKLLYTKDANQVENYLCFNNEVWDTSLALIAFSKCGGDESSHDIEKMIRWLLNKANDDNWDKEPWETLWAITALLVAGKELDTVAPTIKKSLKWVLGLRNADGVLISTHYMSFLLSVLNDVVRLLKLTSREENHFNAAIEASLSYVKNDYLKKRRGLSLWDDEPWIIGHVLLGIAGASKSKDMFFLDLEFNDYLLQWYEKQEWLPGRGWGDIVDTSFNLVGLTNYFIEREAVLTSLSGVSKTDIRDELSAEVIFKFDLAEMPVDMTLRPRWKGRNFKVKQDQCFLLMPYGQPWSNDINILIRDILDKKGLGTLRGDDMKTPDVIEDIWRGINESKVIIADCTGMNPNVLYELGIAHTIGKDVILLTQDINTIAFDVRGLRYITYLNDAEGFRKLRDILPKTIDEVLQIKS